MRMEAPIPVRGPHALALDALADVRDEAHEPDTGQRRQQHDHRAHARIAAPKGAVAKRSHRVGSGKPARGRVFYVDASSHAGPRLNGRCAAAKRRSKARIAPVAFSRPPRPVACPRVQTVRPAPNPQNDAQLVILRASRLEALVPPLLTALEATRPSSVLAAQTIIAAHPGMEKWLSRALARQVGSGGVVANVDVVLPSAWLSGVMRDCLGADADAQAQWQREALRWAVLAALREPNAVAGLSEPRLMHYLGAAAVHDEAERARRQFHLADHLASVFARYLVYRQDWLAGWEKGQSRIATSRANVADDDVALETQLLAPLWRYLRERLGLHRAHRTGELLAWFADHPDYPTALHVFGFSHLGPADQAVLRAWSRHAPVWLYVPDPCREYWGGLEGAFAKTGLANLRVWHAEEDQRIEAAAGGDWLDATQSHPLLQRWGRLGQHFYAGLAEWEALTDIRDHNDTAQTPPTDRLARLQESIRRLEPALMLESEPWPPRQPDETDPDYESRILAWSTPRRADTSVRVHACHTRLRELEVLRDALLDAIAAGIEPGNIVVMAPDIRAYAPLLPAVFGKPADVGERRLPWHLADAPLARSHRLFSTFARLLDLGSSRVTLPEIADLLAVPEIAQALDLSDGGRDSLIDWLAESRAAWGLDADHRRELGAAATDRNTLAWGLDRLMAGYVMADADGHDDKRVVRLPDGSAILPVAGVHGPEGAALGALDALLGHIHAWRELATSSRTASAWTTSLTALLEKGLKPTPDDATARLALETIQRLVARIGEEPALVDEDPVLHFAVVREWLLDGLDAIPEHQRFLVGGITFCGMVPQRAIPFDMVCVLGLDDGVFPRHHNDGGLDLTARLRRIGDRDVRSDDRWLFLETLMSARKRLHLSWLGLAARDGKPRPPAAPLAELLQQLDHAAGLVGIDAVDDPRARPWLVSHPLQPFDARYFDAADAALYSYSAGFAAMHAATRAALPAFLDDSATPPAPMPESVPLASLLRFWKRPAEDLLARRLKLDLSALDGGDLPDCEPLDASISRIETVARRVFFEDALPLGFEPDGTPRWKPDPAPDWLIHGGLLAAGKPGDDAWEKEATAVMALLQAAAGALDPAAQATTHTIDLELNLEAAGRVRLSGVIDQVFESEFDGQRTLQIVRAFPDGKNGLKAADKLNFGDHMGLFLHWAALRLALAESEVASEPAAVVRVVLLAEGDSPLVARLADWDAVFLAEPTQRPAMLAQLRQRLSAIVMLWHEAAEQPPMYFPATSQAALEAWRSEQKPPAKAANARFESASKQHPGERDYAPGWTRILARGRGFDRRDYEDAEADTQALLSYAQQLESLLDLELPVSQNGGGHD